MNIEYGQPHLLFPLAAYTQSQHDLINQFIPELANAEERVVNLASTKQFEELLYHLETTFEDNFEFFDSAGEEPFLKLPSIDIFRILLTLASKCLSNFGQEAPSFGGLIANSEYVRNINDDYNKCIFKSPMRDRCIALLRRYISMLMTSRSSTVVHKLKNLFLIALKDFMVHPRFFHILGPLSNSRYLRSNTSRRKTGSQKKGVEQNNISPSFTEPVETNTDTISDSEEEPPYLSYSSHKDISEEIKKFQPYNISRNERGIFTGDINHGSIQFPNPLFPLNLLDDDSDTTSGSESGHNSKRPKINHGESKSNFENIRVFGDYLISRQLNPMINSPYNIWKLIQWMFYCADLSSMYQKLLFDPIGTNCHLIYYTYKHFIDILVDFLTFNLIDYLVTDKTSKRLLNVEKRKSRKFADPIHYYFQLDGNKRQEIKKLLETNRNILILNIIAQLSPSQVDWYDRVIEHVFTGLNNGNHQVNRNYEPQPCFEVEKFLIRHDSTLRQNISKNYATKYDDNMDSIILRYKIILLVYYWSLFYSIGNSIDESGIDDSSFSDLAPETLLWHLGCKLVKLDCLYLTKFFLAYNVEISKTDLLIQKIYHYKMMFGLAKSILISLTRVNEIEGYFSITKYTRPSDSSLTERLRNIIDLILDQRIYQALVEDETYLDWSHFEQTWSKSNYLLSWLLENSLLDWHINLKDYSKRDELVNYIYTKVEKADRVKVKWFNKFILNHCKDSDSPSKNSVDYNFYLSDDEALKLIVNDKTHTKWIKYKDVLNLQFYSIKK